MASYESRKVGADEFVFPGLNIQCIVKEYDHSELDASFKYFIPIEQGIVVLNVGHLVTEAFAGGTPSAIVGDSSDDDGFLISTDIGETTLNDYAQSLGKANALAGGKYYAAADYVQVTHVTGLTAGKGKVFIFYIDTKENWRNSGTLS